MSRLDDAVFMCESTDRQWWNETQHCGGCGFDSCHPDAPCTSGEEGCRYCPDRIAQGARALVPPVKHQPEVDGQLDLLGEVT